MNENKYYGLIQNDEVGNIIDIFTLDETNQSVLDSFKTDKNYTVLPPLKKPLITLKRTHKRSSLFLTRVMKFLKYFVKTA